MLIGIIFKFFFKLNKNKSLNGLWIGIVILDMFIKSSY